MKKELRAGNAAGTLVIPVTINMSDRVGDYAA
jgi:hypothetical protein